MFYIWCSNNKPLPLASHHSFHTILHGMRYWCVECACICECLWLSIVLVLLVSVPLRTETVLVYWRWWAFVCPFVVFACTLWINKYHMMRIEMCVENWRENETSETVQALLWRMFLPFIWQYVEFVGWNPSAFFTHFDCYFEHQHTNIHSFHRPAHTPSMCHITIIIHCDGAHKNFNNRNSHSASKYTHKHV